ncbi:MAG: hypothetical protein ACYC4Q_07395 [Victivallaceae bacterium]
MRASLNMLVVLVIGITILGCMFKSYRMLGMLKEASSYAKQQQEDKKRFQQFSQTLPQARAQSSIPRQTASTTYSSSRLKMDPHPFGPRLEIKRIADPFGPRVASRHPSVLLTSRPAKQAFAQNQPPAQSQAQPADETASPLPPTAPGAQNIPPDSALAQPLKAWSNYVSTIEDLSK